MENKKKNRCFNCNHKIKRLSAITNKCLCGNIYCFKCRLPENHNCNYDFKNKNNLEKKLVKVEFEKINKI